MDIRNKIILIKELTYYTCEVCKGSGITGYIRSEYNYSDEAVYCSFCQMGNIVSVKQWNAKENKNGTYSKLK